MRRLFGRIIVAVVLAGSVGPLSNAGAQNESDPEATISALQTEVAELSEVEATAEPDADETARATIEATRPAAESEEGGSGGPARTVNVELILDVSGSMGQVLDTGETRMDAAKRVLNGVVAAIPARDGVNVGLRIYGHEGDNSEAGQAVSCRSSELVVPIEGVTALRLVLDSLDTRSPASPAAFPAAEARRLARRLEWHDAPKPGGWLNTAEIELSVLADQCPDRRLPDPAAAAAEVGAWRDARNAARATARWRSTTADARTKLHRLYPHDSPR